MPERTERLHLTLHFLGAVPQRRLPELIDGLRVSFSAFSLHLDRAQRWPNGIAVVTPTAVPQALLALHAALRVGLERLDLATETRCWRPHLTWHAMPENRLPLRTHQWCIGSSMATRWWSRA